MLPDRYWLAPALYMVLITALSSIPGSTGTETPTGPAAWIPPIVSNALHVPVYAGLGFLWAQALIRPGGMPVRQATVAALIIAALFGAADEIYQGLIPGRTTALGDWLADVAGAAVGSVLLLAWHQWRDRRSRS